MFRKTLTIVSLIGLLLSVGLWGVGSFYSLVYASGSWTLGVAERSVIIGGGFPQGWSFAFHQKGWQWQKRNAQQPHFAMPQYDYQPSGGSWLLMLPLWIPSVVFGLTFLSCRPLHFHRRRKRKKLGLCLKCGYDLRMSEGRCPECGADPPGSTKPRNERRYWPLLTLSPMLLLAVGLIIAFTVRADKTPRDYKVGIGEEHQVDDTEELVPQHTARRAESPLMPVGSQLSGGTVEWCIYEHAKPYFAFEYPSTWMLVRGEVLQGRRQHLLIALNNGQKSDLRIMPSSGRYREILAQLPRSSVYVDVGFFVGPVSTRSSRPSRAPMLGDERATQQWQKALGDATEVVLHNGELMMRHVTFRYFATMWTVNVLIHEPISMKDRRLLEKVLESLRFHAHSPSMGDGQNAEEDE